MDTTRASYMISNAFLAAPFWLSLAIAAAIAIMGWSRSPKAAMSILAAVILIVVSVFGTWIANSLISSLFRDPGGIRSWLFWIVHFMSTTAQAAAFVFVCSAAFIDRRAPDPFDRP